MFKKISFKGLMIVFIIVLSLNNSQLIIQSVKNGMLICYNTVIPSLYLFMIIADYRAQPEIINMFSYIFRWYGRLLKINDNYYAGCLPIALMGGFAVGSNYLAKLQNMGYCENSLKVIAITLINNSFAFCVFSIGAVGLGNVWLGAILYASLTFSSLITAFIFSFVYKYNIVSPSRNIHHNDANLVNSIKKAVENILVICCFVIFFNLICEVISLYIYNDNQNSLLFTFFLEVTNSCLIILSDFTGNIYLLCLTLSILPVSTLCQVYYFTGNANIIKTLLLSRLLHIPLSVLILSVFMILFPDILSVSTTITPVYSVLSGSRELSSIMFIITILFIYITDKNRMFTKSE